MEHQVNGTKDFNPALPVQDKNRLRLPLAALGLVLFSTALFALESVTGIRPITIPLMILLQLAGFVMGVVSLVRGRGQKNPLGKTLSILAILIPLAVFAFIVFLAVVLMRADLSGM